jgi:hypothetical protein
LTSREVLWRSVSALMQKHYGKESLGRFAKDCGIGPATMTRIKAQDTSIGVDILDSIASHFHLEPWELLVPNFDPANRPTLQPVSEAERRLWESLREVAKEIKGA